VVAAGAFALFGSELADAVAVWSAGVLGVLGVVAGGFTGALALSVCAPAALAVVAAGAFAFGLLAEALWSAVALLPVAGGFTGALALSAEALAGLLVVAAAAFALASDAGAAAEAWLLVQESEIMLTELTCREPSLPRDP
jgi:hypothetical protein